MRADNLSTVAKRNARNDQAFISTPWQLPKSWRACNLEIPSFQQKILGPLIAHPHRGF
jgi:hypothetical protein